MEKLIEFVKPWKEKPGYASPFVIKWPSVKNKCKWAWHFRSRYPHTLRREQKAVSENHHQDHRTRAGTSALCSRRRRAEMQPPRKTACTCTGWDTAVLMLFHWISWRNFSMVQVCGPLQASWGQRHANSQKQNLPMLSTAEKKVPFFSTLILACDQPRHFHLMMKISHQLLEKCPTSLQTPYTLHLVPLLHASSPQGRVTQACPCGSGPPQLLIRMWRNQPHPGKERGHRVGQTEWHWQTCESEPEGEMKDVVSSMRTLEIKGAWLLDAHRTVNRGKTLHGRRRNIQHTLPSRVSLVYLYHCQDQCEQLFNTAIWEEGFRESFVIISSVRTDWTFVSLLTFWVNSIVTSQKTQPEMQSDVSLIIYSVFVHAL